MQSREILLSGSLYSFSIEPGIAVTLSPRCVSSLFIADLLVTDCSKQHQAQEQQHLSPRVIFLSESPQFASLVSQEAVDKITAKQNEFKSHNAAESTNDVKSPDDRLLKSAMSLSHASSVAIVTVGVSKKQFAAVVYIAKALLAREKEITIIAPENSVPEWKAFLAKCEATEVPLKCIPVTSPGTGSAVHSLGPRFYSTSLNSVVIVNEEGISLWRYFLHSS